MYPEPSLPKNVLAMVIALSLAAAFLSLAFRTAGEGGGNKYSQSGYQESED